MKYYLIDDKLISEEKLSEIKISKEIVKNLTVNKLGEIKPYKTKSKRYQYAKGDYNLETAELVIDYCDEQDPEGVLKLLLLEVSL